MESTTELESSSPTTNDDEWPPFSIVETWWLDLAIEFSVMCGDIRISVIISSQDDDSYLCSKLSPIIEHHDEPGVRQAFLDWALAPLKPLLWQLYPQKHQNRKRLLSEYLRPLALAFRLIDSGKESLLAVPYEGDFKDILQPIYHTLTLSDLDSALQSYQPGKIQLSIDDVPLFKDSEISIEDTDGPDDIYDAPRAVQPFVTQCKMAFKSGFSLESFQREVCTYLILRHRHRHQHQHQLPDTNVRIPALLGLVQNAITLEISGILTQWIDGARMMEDLWTDSTPRMDLRSKWEQQISQTVSALHAVDLVWGDVAPKNVLIDSREDAWVIDFGGGFSTPWTEREWLDENYECTIAGDIKGLARLKAFLQGKYP
ncbi:hypothetical protein ANO11243_005010 [Dothideomycetidae sp. 11243]|nr:hypothetical protein ANO11243_005010 [fungal sp. No.11243]